MGPSMLARLTCGLRVNVVAAQTVSEFVERLLFKLANRIAGTVALEKSSAGFVQGQTSGG